MRERVKASAQQASGGLGGLEMAMRKFSTKGAGETINQDDLLLAFSRANASGLNIDDVKDFYGSVQGNKNGDELSIEEVMQVLKA